MIKIQKLAHSKENEHRVILKLIFCKVKMSGWLLNIKYNSLKHKNMIKRDQVTSRTKILKACTRSKWKP